MEDPIVKQLVKLLKSLGMEFSHFEHPTLVSATAVQTYLGFSMSESAATIIMKADGNFIAVLRRDDTKLSFKKIKKLLEVHDLRVATPEEFIEFTKLPIGAAHPFIPTTKTIVDEKVMEKEFMNGGAGSLTITFRYKTDGFKKIPNSIIADVTE